MEKRVLPAAMVARLPLYLRSLDELGEEESSVSSVRLGAVAGVAATQLRKDLSYLGPYGVRGVGYRVEELRRRLRHELGLTRKWTVVVVGIGNLGTALAQYKGLQLWGFMLVGLFDVDPARVGSQVNGLSISHVDRLESVVKEEGAEIGIVTTPASAAQQVVDRLVKAGVRSVLNFAPAVLQVPPTVTLRRVDVASELQILSHHLTRAMGGPPRKLRAGEANR